MKRVYDGEGPFNEVGIFRCPECKQPVKWEIFDSYVKMIGYCKCDSKYYELRPIKYRRSVVITDDKEK